MRHTKFIFSDTPLKEFLERLIQMSVSNYPIQLVVALLQCLHYQIPGRWIPIPYDTPVRRIDLNHYIFHFPLEPF